MKKLQQSKKKLQQGFTLIELMIVVAVIGVLAAIAMPQYQKYIAKSEVASVLASLTGVKTNVEAYTVESGIFPTNAQSSALGIPVIQLGDNDIGINGVQLTQEGATDAGSIKFTFDDGVKASALVKGLAIELKRTTKTGEWTCGNAISGGSTTLGNDLLPKNCRSIN